MRWMKGPDEDVRLDSDVSVVEQVDVGWMSSPDEPFCLDRDIKVDG